MVVGEPDFPTPQPILRSAQQHLSSGRVRYTPTLGAPELGQRAALAAFDSETLAICEGYRQQFEAQRDYLAPALQQQGFRVAALPRGSFHIYADCSAFTDDSLHFCRTVLEETGVALAPGSDFGAFRARQHLRVSYPKPTAVLSEGIERLRKFLRSHRKPTPLREDEAS